MSLDYRAKILNRQGPAQTYPKQPGGFGERQEGGREDRHVERSSVGSVSPCVLVGILSGMEEDPRR